MASSNRSAQLTKVHKVLKKHYKAVSPDSDRLVLEQLLYAYCLENASYDAAEQGFVALKEAFYDWNEVRVSTVTELAEVLPMLPYPSDTANHVRRTLQSVFESTYSFDLEGLRKENLGQAAGKLQSLDGSTPFAVSYVVQSSLGGHAIPIDSGAANALHVMGIISKQEVGEKNVQGMERAIAKNKGVEFGSLLHHLSADFVANPYSTNLHKILLEIAPTAKDNLPKRTRKKAEEEVEEAKPKTKKKPAASSKKKAATSTTKSSAKKTPAKKKPAAASSKKKGQTKTASSRIAKRKPR